MGIATNMQIPMTRRIPKLSNKQAKIDSEIAYSLIRAWDGLKDPVLMLNIFYQSRNRLSDQRYWELLRTVWICCGCKETRKYFLQFFSSRRPFFYYIMTPEEHDRLMKMDEEITVWRSESEGGNGWSWTLKKDIAERFAQRSKRNIIEKRVKKEDIFAFFERRGEEEILIIPEVKRHD